MSKITRRDLMAGAAGLAAAGTLGVPRAFAQDMPTYTPEAGRLAAPAALGAVRRRRGGSLERQHQGVHRGDRRRGPHRPGELGGRPPQGRRRRQCRLRPRHGDELVRRPVPVSRQAGRRDRARRARSARRTAAGTTGPKGYATQDGKFIAMPLCAIGNAICYRESHMKAAGFNEFPKDTDGFLELCKAMKAKGTPAGFPHGKAVGDGNNYAHWLLWSHGGKMVNENGDGRRSTAPRPGPRSNMPRRSTRPSSPAPRAGSTSTTTAPSSPARSR